MKRTKTPKKTKPAKTGPKSLCTPEVIEQAYEFALLGLTNWQMAKHFGVKEDTVNGWYRKYPAFQNAVDDGREKADSKVAKMLFKVGMGQVEQPAVKFFKTRVTEKEYDEEGNVTYEKSYDKIIQQPYTKRYQPDTKALIKWLSTRNRETWGEAYKVEHDHRHAHMIAGNINIHTVLEQITDTQAYTDEELKIIAKLGLNEIAEHSQKEVEYQR